MRTPLAAPVHPGPPSVVDPYLVLTGSEFRNLYASWTFET